MINSAGNNPLIAPPRSIERNTVISSHGSAGNLNRLMEAGRDFVAGIKSIILDEDDREIKFNTRKLPWRAICALDIKSENGIDHGTGWLAGPNTVITCGHCVYSGDFSGWASQIVVTPGRTSRGDPFGSFSSTNFFCAESWMTDESIEFDIGAIHLDESPGARLGWFGFDEVGADTEDTIANVSGYSEFDGAYNKLLTDEGPIAKVHDGRLFYPIDTDVGQSGSPVWKNKSTADPIPIALGVHAYNTEKTPTSLGIEANSATALTADIVKLIHRWTGASHIAGT